MSGAAGLSGSSSGWLDCPAGRWVAVTLAPLLCIAPALMLGDLLAGFRLQFDDFVYVALSRDGPTLRRNLFTPHNAHVVPLFRILTYFLISTSGGLEGLPSAFRAATYLSVVLTMLATGAFVARETGRLVLGGAAMAALGVSTVWESVLTWYSAGQALWSGLFIVLMLLRLQGWKRRGGAWRLALGALAASAAPMFWSGGYVAGPVGLAYLWADRRPAALKAGLVPLAASIVTALVFFTIAGKQIASAGNFHDRPLSEAFRPLAGLGHTAQAVPEILVLRNFGLDATTTLGQGVVLCLALGWVWNRTRRGSPRPNPLEAAGAVMAGLAFWIAYSSRGYYPFANLRGLGWHHAIPQIGAVVFAAGWWSGESKPPRPWRPSRREALVLIGLAGLLAVLHRPLARKALIDQAPPLVGSERNYEGATSFRILRATTLAGQFLERQRRFLARLDRATRTANELGVGREEIRRACGRVVGPGMPNKLPHFDALDMLAIRDRSRPVAEVDPDRIRTAFAPLLNAEPRPRPSWLERDDPWPPRTASAVEE